MLLAVIFIFFNMKIANHWNKESIQLKWEKKIQEAFFVFSIQYETVPALRKALPKNQVSLVLSLIKSEEQSNFRSEAIRWSSNLRSDSLII